MSISCEDISSDKMDDILSKEKLLLEWISVAESQICSLEVLSSQLPKMNVLLEDSMLSLGDGFSVLASQVQAQSNNLENISNSISEIKIAEEKTTLIDELTAINSLAEQLGNADLSAKTSGLLDAVTKQNDVINATVKISEVSSKAMVSAVSNAIVNMQFQDRVSQNIVIAENVVNENIKHLKENIDKTITEYKEHLNFAGDKQKVGIDIEFTKRLVSLLTLGELQHQFVDYLLAHGYIKSGDEVGFEVSNNDECDDIELF